MTSPHLDQWPPTDARYRRSEVTALIGSGDVAWRRATHAVMLWGVKTASGFSVDSTGPAFPRERVTVTAHVCGVTVVEPVEVLTVVNEPDRRGFSYRTLPGHPVDGEEAFLVHRRGDDIHLTIRSLTRAASDQPWRLLFPLLLFAQRVVRGRYLKALA